MFLGQCNKTTRLDERVISDQIGDFRVIFQRTKTKKTSFRSQTVA